MEKQTENFWNRPLWNRPPCTYLRSAQWELFYILAISLSPIYIASIAIWLTGNEYFLEAVRRVLEEGELIIYMATLMAPVVYSTQKDPPVKAKNIFLAISGVLISFGVLFYTLHTLKMIQKDIFLLSVIVALIAIILLYLNLFFVHRASTGTNSPFMQQKASAEFKSEFDTYMSNEK